MPDLPLVSVITPSYNQGSYLEETIMSVLKQDYPRFEYILIDGNSKDNSIEIIKKYDEKITKWISQPDRGQSDALVKGFKFARGKYLLWVCSDDILEPSMISLSVNFLEQNPKAVLSYGNRTRIDSKGNIIGFSKSYINSKLFKYGLGLPQETVMFRKDIYEKVGGINSDLNMVMDYDLWCRMDRIGSFLYIPAYLGRFRSHNENKSSNFSKEMDQNNFRGKLTDEFSNIYKMHFNRKFSLKKRRAAQILNSFYRILLTRNKVIRKMKADIIELQNS